jgi:pyruvate formate lyase activating enzyme
METAKYFESLPDQKVKCTLCPHYCNLSPGKYGVCKVRKNHDGRLATTNYGQVSAIRFDPIEKKPLYHYQPGSKILSVGSVGCNLSCKFCQNYEISQCRVEDYPYLHHYSAEDVVRAALKEPDNCGISYTYNEPTVWYEFMLDIASLASQKNLANVVVTNGYINLEPLEELGAYIDAFSLDLKAFNDSFYRRLTGASLDPVLATAKAIYKMGKHLEITNLVVTHENDNAGEFTDMVKWIAEELGPDVVLHISRYFPTYKLEHEATPESTLKRFYEIALEHLDYVYLGNVRTQNGQNTYCKNCGELAIGRDGYITTWEGLDEKGNCSNCGEHIISR